MANIKSALLMHLAEASIFIFFLYMHSLGIEYMTLVFVALMLSIC